MALRRKKVQWFEDTAANWTAENPILPASWAGVESDTGQTKLGDGATAWNSLSYAAGGGGAATLNDLTDVVITTPQQGENLKHNGTNWINQQLDLSDLSDVALSSPAAGEVLSFNGAQFVNSEITDGHLQAGIDAAKLADGSVSNTEFQYLNGVTSNIQTQIDAVNAAEVLKGTWDASAGTFPGAGAAQAGWKYIVSVGGTVDSVVFNVGDRIVAILDNASTSTYAANWFIEDYTDKVSSVNGQTGVVVVYGSELDGDTTLPANCTIRELRTLTDGRFYHASATDTWDQILKASNFGVRAVTGTSDTILSTDDKKLVTFTNAAAIAVTLPQAGSGSPAAWLNGWGFEAKNIGQSVVTITPTTSTINGAATLVLLPGQAAFIRSNGTNYLAVVTTDRIRPLAANHGTDDTYEGEVITGLNAGATIAQWEPVYLGGSSTWLLADANGSGTYPARGLATAAYSNTNSAVILIRGTVRNDAWNWTIGAPIYLSGTAGALTQTAPSTSGDKVQVVGYALTADIAVFDFNGTYLTVT